MRALVAAVAAYAFALQMLLGGIVVTPMAATVQAGEFVLCQGSGSLPPGGGKAGTSVIWPARSARCFRRRRRCRNRPGLHSSG